MKQLLLIWYFIFILNYTMCSECNTECYPDLLEQNMCVNVRNNTNCEWTDKIVSYDVQQNKYGIVNINIPMLATCNSSNYLIMLHLNRNITSATNCSQDFMVDTMKWTLHSKIRFKPNSTCGKDENYNVPGVTFDYVFTGCYRILVQNEEERDMGQSYPVFISTDYKKKILSHKDNITVNWNYLKEEILQTIVRINSTDIDPPPSISISLSEPHNNNRIVKGTIKVVNVSKESGTFDQKFDECKSIPNVTFYCKIQRDYYGHIKYICEYKGLNPGKYMFQYKLLYEYTRCNKGSLWAKSSEPCDRYVHIDVPQINSTNKNKEFENSPTEFYITIAIITTLMILVILCVLIYKQVHKNASIQHTLISDYNKLHTSSNKTVLTDVPQEVLLIYTTESDLFSDVILSFKELLKTENISIFDINVYNEEINIDPQKWILEKISNSNTVVILFLNVCGLMTYEKYPNIPYRDEEYQDKLCIFAIKQLQIATNRNDTNLFVLQLNNFPTDDSIFKSLPIEKRYTMPRDIQILLNKFFSHDQEWNKDCLNEFKRCCNRHEELPK